MLIIVLLMLSFFVYNSIIVTWCIQKGVNLVYMVCNVSASLQHFYFDQHSRKQNFLNSFVDCSITDAKLFFEAPTQPGMMIDDTVRLVIVHAIVERNF